MTVFLITLGAVAVMLCYAIPGFALVKTKHIKEEAIPAFAKILMYVCGPCLTIYTIADAPFSWKLVKDAGVVLVVSLVIQIFLLLLFKFLFRKHNEDVKYRVCIIATGMGNCGFMGVPLLEALMPEHPEAVLMSSVFCLGMNFIGWTLASYIISNDKSYMRVRNAVLNPNTLSLIVAIPLFVTGFQLPELIHNMIILLGKMSAPMCMLIMGMRLATMDFKELFNDKMIYGILAVKQIGMPLLALGIMLLLPVDAYLVKTMFILSAAPVASVVLNFAEMIGQGQKRAANLVLLGTMLSILSIPVMMLIVYGRHVM